MRAKRFEEVDRFRIPSILSKKLYIRENILFQLFKKEATCYFEEINDEDLFDG